jgi:ribosomal protein S21
VVVNLEVKLEDCHDDVGLLIKKFLRKCKKSNLYAELHAHDYYKKPSTVRREEEKERAKTLRRLKRQQESAK